MRASKKLVTKQAIFLCLKNNNKKKKKQKKKPNQKRKTLLFQRIFVFIIPLKYSG